MNERANGGFQISKSASNVLEKESFECQNPRCKKVFDTPIFIHDLSSQTTYYGCPFCLTKTEKSYQKRDEAHQLKTPPKEAKKKQEAVKCSHFYGYLSQREKGAEMPEECLTCKKMVDCMLYKIRESK